MRAAEYPEPRSSCSHYHIANQTMLPFRLSNQEGLSNHVTALFYRYHPSPTCSPAKPYCASPYLFCHLPQHRCLAKVRLHGRCDGFQGTRVCYQGRCHNGTCRPYQAQLKIPEPPEDLISTQSPLLPTDTDTHTHTTNNAASLPTVAPVSGTDCECQSSRLFPILVHKGTPLTHRRRTREQRRRKALDQAKKVETS